METLLQAVFGDMKNKEADVHECFLAALKHMTDKPEVKQATIARAVGVVPQHLNAIINKRLSSSKKVTKAPQELQQAIADYFGYAYIDFLKLGAQLLEGTAPAPGASFPARDETSLRGDPAISSGNTATQLASLVSDIANELDAAHKEINRWKSTLESIADGVLITDDELRVIYTNHAYRELAGCNPVGKFCYEQPSCQDEIHGCVIREAMDAMLPVRKERPFGNHAAVSLVASPIKTPSGDVDRVVVTVKDISLKKQAMDENEALAARLSLLVECLEHGFVVTNEKSEVMFYNSRFSEILGSTEKLTTTDQLDSLWVQQIQNPAEFLNVVHQLKIDKAPTSIECKSIDGNTSWLLYFKPIKKHDGRFLGFMGKIEEVP